MPTYSYACKDCENAFDLQQAFTDDALTVCPECGGRLRKRYGSVGVVFKGSGFYRTDSRKADSSKADSRKGAVSTESKTSAADSKSSAASASSGASPSTSDSSTPSTPPSSSGTKSTGSTAAATST